MENQVQLASFFQSLTLSNNKSFYFCIAKFLLHMAADRVDITGNQEPRVVLGILSEIPNAAAVISLHPL